MNDVKKPDDDHSGEHPFEEGGAFTPPDPEQEIPGNELEETELADFEEDADDDNSEQKTAILPDIVLGLGLSVVIYLLIWGAFAAGMGIVMQLLVSLLLVGSLLLIVKLFKSGRRTIAITMLVMLSVPLLAILVVGACALIFFPPWG